MTPSKAVPVTVTLYTAPGCSLCDDAKAEIQRAQRGTPFVFEEVDISRDAALEARYRARIPYLLVNGRPAFKYRVTAEALADAVRRAAFAAR